MRALFLCVLQLQSKSSFGKKLQLVHKQPAHLWWDQGCSAARALSRVLENHSCWWHTAGVRQGDAQWCHLLSWANWDRVQPASSAERACTSPCPSLPGTYPSAIPPPPVPITDASADSTSMGDMWSLSLLGKITWKFWTTLEAETRQWAILFSARKPQDEELHCSHPHWKCSMVFALPALLQLLYCADVLLTALKRRAIFYKYEAIIFFLLFTDTFLADFKLASHSPSKALHEVEACHVAFSKVPQL